MTAPRLPWRRSRHEAVSRQQRRNPPVPNRRRNIRHHHRRNHPCRVVGGAASRHRRSHASGGGSGAYRRRAADLAPTFARRLRAACRAALHSAPAPTRRHAARRPASSLIRPRADPNTAPIGVVAGQALSLSGVVGALTLTGEEEPAALRSRRLCQLLGGAR